MMGKLIVNASMCLFQMRFPVYCKIDPARLSGYCKACDALLASPKRPIGQLSLFEQVEKAKKNNYQVNLKLNPSNTKATFGQRTRTQTFLKNI